MHESRVNRFIASPCPPFSGIVNIIYLLDDNTIIGILLVVED